MCQALLQIVTNLGLSESEDNTVNRISKRESLSLPRYSVGKAVRKPLHFESILKIH